MAKIHKIRFKYLTNKPGTEINKSGQWVRWEDTGHGSGLTVQERAATKKEIKIMKAFDVLLKAGL